MRITVVLRSGYSGTPCAKDARSSGSARRSTMAKEACAASRAMGAPLWNLTNPGTPSARPATARATPAFRNPRAPGRQRRRPARAGRGASARPRSARCGRAGKRAHDRAERGLRVEDGIGEALGERGHRVILAAHEREEIDLRRRGLGALARLPCASAVPRRAPRSRVRRGSGPPRPATRASAMAASRAVPGRGRAHGRSRGGHPAIRQRRAPSLPRQVERPAVASHAPRNINEARLGRLQIAHLEARPVAADGLGQLMHGRTGEDGHRGLRSGAGRCPGGVNGVRFLEHGRAAATAA